MNISSGPNLTYKALSAYKKPTIKQSSSFFMLSPNASLLKQKFVKAIDELAITESHFTYSSFGKVPFKTIIYR